MLEIQTKIQHPADSVSRYEKLMTTLVARGLIAKAVSDKGLLFDNNNYVVIGPGSGINGGAYVDIGSKTATAVDIGQDPILKDFLKRMLPAYKKIADRASRKEGLVGLSSVINHLLEYDVGVVTSLCREDCQSDCELTLRHLGQFILIRKGICTQRALLTAVSLEYARDIDAIDKDTVVSVESGYNEELHEYHTFVLLGIDNEVWKIDSAQPRDRRACIV